MTDKATVTIPSPTSGIVTEFSGEVGDMVAVGSTLVTFATDGNTGNQVEKEPVPEEIIKPVVEEKIIQEPVKEEKTKQIPKPIRAAVTQSKQITPSNGNSRVLASPAVRRRAREVELDLSIISGSGPAGRIRHADLDAYIAAGGTAVSYTHLTLPTNREV